ncbi:MAG: type II toxin-antitoxin system VapC family toxin [Sedimenticola sp.]
MNLLLDTHILLWWMADAPQLTEEAREKIADPDNTVFVSAATVWEMGIKQALGKLKVPENVVDLIRSEGFDELVISGMHAQLAAGLPNHHRDPFDRMLIAQAKLEGLLLITHDSAIQNYDAKILMV